jgi:hypothetical protein
MHTDRFCPPSDPSLAVFIRRSGTGILYRMRGSLFIQDMQWHERFRNAPCSRKPHFIEFALEEEVENDVRAICRLIHDRHLGRNASEEYRIPYAFRHGGNTRFNRAGELMLSDGLGLTCSTFVMTVFQSVEFPLVNFEGWQRRADDDARHEQLLEMMRCGIPESQIAPAPPEHVARVKAELPCTRVRPEEAAATALLNDLPAVFEQLAPAGAWVLAQTPLLTASA